MKVITVRSQIRDVAERWKALYRRQGKWAVTMGSDMGRLYEALKALNPETATADDVAMIIGNKSWAGPLECHNCGEEFDAVVEVGQEPDYDSHTARLCHNCLRHALALLKADEIRGHVQHDGEPHA
jgi:hypothetical protein